MPDITIEDLQAQLAELKDSAERDKARLAELETQNSKFQDDLTKSRELNSQLLLRVPVTNAEPEPEPEESLEDIIGGLVDEVNNRYVSRYKS